MTGLWCRRIRRSLRYLTVLPGSKKLRPGGIAIVHIGHQRLNLRYRNTQRRQQSCRAPPRGRAEQDAKHRHIRSFNVTHFRERPQALQLARFDQGRG